MNNEGISVTLWDDDKFLVETVVVVADGQLMLIIIGDSKSLMLLSYVHDSIMNIRLRDKMGGHIGR